MYEEKEPDHGIIVEELVEYPEINIIVNGITLIKKQIIKYSPMFLAILFTIVTTWTKLIPAIKE